MVNSGASVRPATWVFLRGLAREKGHWGSFTERFAARFPHDEVLPVDLPGSGEFHKSTAPGSMSEVFQFVRGQVMERAKHPGTLKLFALSLGGMVAMEWQRQRSDELAACVLINSSSKSSPIHQRLRWQIWGQFVKLAVGQTVRERERGIIDLTLNNSDAKAEALPLWTKIGTERPISYLSFLNQLRSAATFAELAQATPVPTLLLNSLGDRLVDPSCSSRLHDSMGWPIRRHPWAGHDLTWDDPEWTIRQVEDWNISLASG